MILSELRIMGGPNMWSDVPKLVVMKISNDTGRLNFGKLSEWIEQEHVNLNQNLKSKDQPLPYVANLLSQLTKILQPDSENLFTAVKLLGPDSYYALTEYADKETGTEAAYAACEILDALIEGKQPVPLAESKARIAQIHAASFLGPSTSTIVNAALKRNIPARRSHGGFIVFGQGAYQKKISASISENTSDISVDIAGDKDITKQILKDAMVPVPKGHVVKSREYLEQLTTKLEFPVVVKPLNANQGKGITLNINNKEALIPAFTFAKTFSNLVLIESQISGNDYRFLVVGNKLIAVAHRTPASVIGDGISTIKQLVDKINADPLRGDGHGKVLTKIKIDELTLNILKAKQLTPDSILENGVSVLLKDTANLSTGGTAVDVTDDVHPDNIVLAERVAALIGLDICGIDIMAPDIKTPIIENGGAVLEVNAAPGLRMHTSPSRGKARNIGDPIVDLMYPKDARFRVPIVAITGTNGKTTTTRLMAHVVREQGFKVGFTTSDGIYLNTTRIVKGDCTGSQSAALVLQEPSVEFAVLESARGGIIRSGLAFDHCDIGIVTNVAADHIGLKDIYTVEDLAKVKSVVPRSVKPDGYAILNASDDLVYNMKKDLNCRVALFSIDAKNPRIKEHCGSGGVAAIMTEDKELAIIKGSEIIIVDDVMNIPLSMDGNAEFMIDNILPVVLAGYLLNFNLNTIRNAVRTFTPSVELTPGRLNKFEVNNINVLLDYAHNPHGLKALGKYLDNLDRKITGIITAVGDRRDEDIIEVGKVAAKMYDKIIIRFDKDTRGRTRDEIARLIIQGIVEVNPGISYQIIEDSEAALKYAVSNSEKGEYVVISADDTNETIEIVQKLEEEFQNAEL